MFRSSQFLDEPYTMAGINVIAADTDEEAKRLSTSMIRMMLGVMTNNIDYLQAPEEFTKEFEDLLANPSFQRMTKYAFIDSQETVQRQTLDFIERTAVNEVIIGSNIYDPQARIRSIEIFAEAMKAINEGCTV